MSLITIEGFDHYDVDTWISKLIWNDGSINTSGGRYQGGGAWIANGDTGAYFQTGLGGNYQEIIVGFALYLDGSENGLADDAVAFYDQGGTLQGRLSVGSGNTLFVTRGASSIIATGSVSLTLQRWYYIEIRYKVSNTVGEVEVRIDGVVDINLSGADTQASTTYSSIRNVRFQTCRYPNGVRIDDLYILDTGSGARNDFLGDCRVDTLFPSSDGTTNDWTPLGGGSNYVEVDDNPPDEDTSYVYSSTDGDIDLYGHEVLSQATSVFGVQVSAYLQKDDAGALWARLGVRSGGSNYFGTVEGVGASWAFQKEIFELNPATASDWTTTSINAAEIGIERIGVVTTPAPTTLTSSPPTTAGPTTAAPTTLLTTAAPTTL